METTVVGDLNCFAIEYGIENRWPPYGHVRLWIRNNFIGDVRRSIFLYHMCRSLDVMMNRDRKIMPAIYRDPSEVPRHDDFFSQPSLSWGDSFDDFFVQIYTIESECRIHFLWELELSRSEEFPNYPVGKHHESISYNVFDTITSKFLRNGEFVWPIPRESPPT